MNALNYQEQKVKKGVAECLLADNFLLDHNHINFHDKLNRFKYQNELNTSVKTKLLHASLNFEPSEKLSKDELIKIASAYMDKIGFSNQPYLVYQHEDAGHPHIHILTTTIKEDGSPIYVHNIGRNQSEKARSEIENEFGLVQASGRNNGPVFEIPPVNIEKAVYGKSETKRSITNVLDAVIKQYKYTTLAELNAVLQVGNVIADRGKPEGRIYKNAGLVYRILDAAGNKIGKPIKSSSIYSKPTLSNLEIHFAENKLRRAPGRGLLKREITNVLQSSRSMLDFIGDLKQNRIDAVIRRNETGFIYGITFIDHKSKCVFNGSDLGKHLSAAGIQQHFSTTSQNVRENHTTDGSVVKKDGPQSSKIETFTPGDRQYRFERRKTGKQSSDELIRQYDLLKQLMQNEKAFNQIPFDLTRKRKKKKKKRNQNI